jgi:hypothetical protein
MSYSSRPGPVEVELLYLNLDSCGRCQGADRNLDSALEAVSRVLGEAGHQVTVRKTHVTTQEEAAALGFVSSPTIRVNGRDIAVAVEESTCGACSSLAGTEVGCRTWGWQEQSHTSPPVGMIIDAILSSVYRPDTDTGPVPAPAGTGSVDRFLAATR